MRSTLNFIFLATMFFVIPAVSASADEIPPDKVQIVTPVYKPDSQEIDFPLGTYNYTVSWAGIPAADASIDLRQEGLKYRIVASASTYSGIDLLYKLRYKAQGLISMIDFLPERTIIDQSENSRVKNTQISYLENGNIFAVRSQKGKETQTINFNPQNFTLEPFSAAFLARGLKWELGQTAEFDTFNGKTRYLISLTAVDKIQMTVNDVPRDVWVISPVVKRLTTTEKFNKLRDAKIYITADKSREILKIVSEVFIGSVTTKLDSFTPAPVAGSIVAKENHTVKLVF